MYVVHVTDDSVGRLPAGYRSCLLFIVVSFGPSSTATSTTAIETFSSIYIEMAIEKSSEKIIKSQTNPSSSSPSSSFVTHSTGKTIRILYLHNYISFLFLAFFPP